MKTDAKRITGDLGAAYERFRLTFITGGYSVYYDLPGDLVDGIVEQVRTATGALDFVTDDGVAVTIRADLVVGVERWAPSVPWQVHIGVPTADDVFKNGWMDGTENHRPEDQRDADLATRGYGAVVNGTGPDGRVPRWASCLARAVAAGGGLVLVRQAPPTSA